ncbi:Mediator of RNA polymerase II transcription subunit 7 [Tulasnella sp. JGI-2019a]|nr:Mediator of RNA polymerase II transcription subunit 7 [Tulasnella sp. JGI-2019a]KAG9006235.1 Mediator of RNA polymerase II transcription subunit 7 [Tulasnella sp. JGI-2019a]KAG9039458.1 Mediator of RNA polymerase II transcription subunit 7 [Tulasnella sp. JGI-2019a]
MEVPQDTESYPIPPERFKSFTDANLNLLKLVRERTQTTLHEPLPEGTNQADILNDQPPESIPDLDVTVLEPPRLDWIIEGGRFEMYKDPWPIVNGRPTIPEINMQDTVPRPPGVDQREALRKMLKTLLRGWYSVLGSLTEHLPVNDNALTPWDEEIHFMNSVGTSFMSAVNSYRPLQARTSLEELLLKQLRERQEETKAVHQRCDAIENHLALLRAQAQAIRPKADTAKTSATDAPGIKPTLVTTPIKEATTEDVLHWAQDIG